MPRDSMAIAVMDVLRSSLPRIGCAALAVLSPGPRVSLCWAEDPQDRVFAEEQLRGVAERLFREATERRTGFIQNKVRLVQDGPLVCRVLVVPLHGVGGALAGLLVGVNRPEAPELDERGLRRAARIAQVLAPSLVSDNDMLTGLLNYSAFDRLARAALAEAGGSRICSVLYGDIDLLHVANDIGGFGAGDRLITRVGQIIQDGLAGHRALAARLSGDRFTALLLDCTLPQARRIADEIRERVAGRAHAEGEPDMPISISWGAAAVGEDALDLQHALAAAEIACKAAKDRGRNRVEVYQDADHSIIRRRDDVLIVGSLRDALDEDRLQVYAQPIVPLASQAATPTSYELLARLEEPGGRIVEPVHFMSAATRYQLWSGIDRAVIRKSFRFLDAARSQVQDAGLRFSINLSGPTLGDPGFLEWLLAEMASYSIDGEWLAFEVTETAATADLSRAQDLIRRLKTRGCRFALDDFGTGVNSLAYLKALDVDVIKLDGSYVRDIVENQRSEALVRAVTALAGSMGIATVAEYVETGAIRRRVTELGVQFGQGFALGRPRPMEQVFESPDMARSSPAA